MRSIIPISRKRTEINWDGLFSLWVSREDSHHHPAVSDPMLMLKPSLLNFPFHKQRLSSSCYLKVAHSRGLALLTTAKIGLNQGPGGHSAFTNLLLCLWNAPMTDNTGSHWDLCQSKRTLPVLFLWNKKANDAPRPKDFTVINKASQVWRKTFQTSDIWWPNLEGNWEGNYFFFI